MAMKDLFNWNPSKLEEEEHPEEEHPEEKIYDSDGDEVNVGLTTRGCNYKGFKDCGPPKFNAKKDSIDTFEWIDRMNRNEIDRVENKFLNFKAGNMTRRQYTSRYNDLAQLVPHLVETEERLIKYYVNGVIQRVRIHVKANLPSTFESVVNLTEAKKPRAEEHETCKKRGKQHRGECLAGSIMYYKCGKALHYSRECWGNTKCQNGGLFRHVTKDCRKTGQSGAGNEKEQEQPKARTRAYALTEEEARGNPDIVLGTFLVNDEHVAILFDSGAIKSFISNTFSRKLDCTVSNIVRAFNVETDVDRNSAVFQMTDDCIIEIEGHKFPSILFLMTFGS
ncbi:hypothetical protein L1987_34079 [Smallanthus sonchifolius]|uniref:Uncharacterized protein n=1 Tax=Smallanthus sonchifolius TaxID=185202 RepID=A0ACB9HUI1_9ASTR|nr:hypothetical protein L1987_34079 [Smallanthus sonchifolius]